MKIFPFDISIFSKVISQNLKLRLNIPPAKRGFRMLFVVVLNLLS